MRRPGPEDMLAALFYIVVERGGRVEIPADGLAGRSAQMGSSFEEVDGVLMLVIEARDAPAGEGELPT